MMPRMNLEKPEWVEELVGVIPSNNPRVAGPCALSGTLILLDGHRVLYVIEGLQRYMDKWLKVVVWDIWFSDPYETIYDLTVGDGKPLYCASNGVKRFVVWGMWGSPNERECKAYDDVSKPSIVHGKPLYCATHQHKQFVVWGEKEYPAYGGVRDISIVDGKPLYCAYRDGKSFVVWGEKEYPAYDDIRDLTFACGQPLYHAERCATEETRVHFVVWGDKKGKVYDWISELSFTGGKPLYCAQDGARCFIVWGEQEYRVYDGVYNLSFADGKPLYRAQRKGKELVVWGEEESKPYDKVWFPTCANSKPLYYAWRDGEDFVVWGEQEHGAHGSHHRSVENVRDLALVGEKPLYRASYGIGADTEYCVVWGNEESPHYTEVLALHVEGDKIVFGARVGPEIYRVSRRIA